MSYFLDHEVDLELTGDEDACVAKSFMRELDIPYLNRVGLNSAGMREFPLFYVELGRQLDDTHRSVIASGFAACLEPRCGSLAAGLPFGRDLVALLLVDRDYRLATSDLVDAMSDDASALPSLCG